MQNYTRNFVKFEISSVTSLYAKGVFRSSIKSRGQLNNLQVRLLAFCVFFLENRHFRAFWPEKTIQIRYEPQRFC